MHTCEFALLHAKKFLKIVCLRTKIDLRLKKKQKKNWGKFKITNLKIFCVALKKKRWSLSISISGGRLYVGSGGGGWCSGGVGVIRLVGVV